MSAIEQLSSADSNTGIRGPEIQQAPHLHLVESTANEAEYPWNESLTLTGYTIEFDDSIEGEMAYVLVTAGCGLNENGMITPYSKRTSEDGAIELSFPVDADGVATLYTRGIRKILDEDIEVDLIPSYHGIHAESFQDEAHAEEYVAGCVEQGFYPEILHVEGLTVVTGMAHHLEGATREDLLRSGRERLRNLARQEGTLHKYAI